MNADSKHTVGAVLLWGSVAVAGLGTWLASEGMASLGFGLLAVAVPTAFVGAIIKRAYCPRCRGEAGCEVRVRDSGE